MSALAVARAEQDENRREMMARSKALEWLRAHQDHPNKDNCLIWPFGRDRREGRAAVKEDGVRRLAHRVMCRMVHGPAPTDKPQTSHSCGNGHLGCVNPHHLSWANNSENQLVRYAQGRTGGKARGNKSQFTPEQIEAIRSRYGELTQQQLAEMHGVSIPTIQYYLKYRVTRGHDPTSSQYADN